MSKSMRANLLLLLTAMIWGVAFVAQDVAMDALAPFSFNGIRMAVAALTLTPVVMLMSKKAVRTGTADFDGTGAGVPFFQMKPSQRKTLLLGGLCCGVMLTLGSACQQTAISMGAGAGKAGFVTALYIVLVPLAGLFSRRRVRASLWLAVAISAVGLYLLCIKSGFTVEKSDLLLILGAACFTGHILVVDIFSRKTDCVRMSQLQFAVVAVLCLLCAALWEHPTWAAVRTCLIPILYAGMLSGAVGYTLQIVAQRDTDPTVASLIMCLESVFAVVAGWLILGDTMSVREYLGCAAMLCGIVLAQLPGKRKTAL